MHIPDGFLDITTASITYAIFLIYGGYVIKKLRRERTLSEYVPLVSVLATAIFAAQMLNWPIPGGTNLHFVGGALAGIILGLWLGFLSMFLVLFIQCLVFHDGGITALGANVLNMAVIDVLIGYLIYRALTKTLKISNLTHTISVFLGGWLGIIFAGLACGL